MADNIDITPGTGKTVATDEVGGAHYQVVKLAVGTSDSVDGHLDYGVQASTSSISIVLASDHAAVGVGGAVAHDSPDSGNPLKLGAKAISAEPAAVTANDRVNLQASLTGKLVVSPHALGVLCATAYTTITGATTDKQLVAAGDATTRTYVTGVIISNKDTATSTEISFKDGGTTKLIFPAPKESGAIFTFATPYVGATASSTAVACGAAATSVSVSITYFTGA